MSPRTARDLEAQEPRPITANEGPTELDTLDCAEPLGCDEGLDAGTTVEVPWPLPVAPSVPEQAQPPVSSPKAAQPPAQSRSRLKKATTKGPRNASRKKKAKPKLTVIRSTWSLGWILAQTYPDPDTGKPVRAPSVAKVAYEYLLFLAAKQLAGEGTAGQIAVTDGTIMEGVKRITGKACSKSTAKRCRAFFRASGLVLQEEPAQRQVRGLIKGQALLDTPMWVVEVRDNPEHFRAAFATQSRLDLLEAIGRAENCHREDEAFVALLKEMRRGMEQQIAERDGPKPDPSADPGLTKEEGPSRTGSGPVSRTGQTQS